MVSMNITIEDTSPMIKYKGGWWFPKNFGDYGNYSANTFQATSNFGASASFNFTGTAVYIYGARGPYHDHLQVYLDDQANFGSGYMNATSYGEVLFSAENLDNGPHFIVLKNTFSDDKKPWLDLDRIVFTIQDGHSGTQAVSKNVSSTTENWTWNGEWTMDEKNASDSGAVQQHRSWAPTSFVTIPFTGNAVEVHGVSDHQAGRFLVQIDGGARHRFNSSSRSPDIAIPDSLLFFTNGLSHGPHNITFTHMDSKDRYVGVNYIRTWSFEKPRLSNRKLAAILASIFGFLFLVGLIILIVLWRKRRQRKAHTQKLEEARPFMALSPVSGAGSPADQSGPRPFGSFASAMSPVLERERQGSEGRVLPSGPWPDEKGSVWRSITAATASGSGTVHERGELHEPLLGAAQSTPSGGRAPMASSRGAVFAEDEDFLDLRHSVAPGGEPPGYSTPPSTIAHMLRVAPSPPRIELNRGWREPAYPNPHGS